MFKRQEDGSEHEKDYVLRQLRKLVQAIKAMVRMVEQSPAQDADDVLQRAAQDALRVDPQRLDSLDPASCHLILRSGVKLRMYAMILRAQATLSRRRGDESAAHSVAAAANG